MSIMRYLIGGVIYQLIILNFLFCIVLWRDKTFLMHYLMQTLSIHNQSRTNWLINLLSLTCYFYGKTIKSQKVLACIGLFDNFSLKSEVMTVLEKKVKGTSKRTESRARQLMKRSVSLINLRMQAVTVRKMCVMYCNGTTVTTGKHTHTHIKQIPYTHLVVVVHAGEVSPAFVASDLNETLKETEDR